LLPLSTNQKSNNQIFSQFFQHLEFKIFLQYTKKYLKEKQVAQKINWWWWSTSENIQKALAL
jgi:hypothetical protein